MKQKTELRGGRGKWRNKWQTKSIARKRIKSPIKYMLRFLSFGLTSCFLAAQDSTLNEKKETKKTRLLNKPHSLSVLLKKKQLKKTILLCSSVLDEIKSNRIFLFVHIQYLEDLFTSLEVFHSMCLTWLLCARPNQMTQKCEM